MKPLGNKNLAFSLLVLLAVAFATTAASALPARWNTTQRGLILVPDEAHGVTMNLAVQRLRSKSPIRLDLVDGVRDNRTDPANYDITIILGVTGTNKELAQAWSSAAARPKADDAWALKTISTNPLVIVATGNRPRAVLYAVWTLADKLALGEDLTTLSMQEVPRVDKRYAWICGTAYGGYGFNPKINRHTLFMTTLDEMPLHGINGVYLVPGMCRVAVGPGLLRPTVLFDKTGKLTIDESKTAEWRAMFGMIKAYDLDIVITVEPLTHPAYNTAKLTQDYLINGNRPAPNYLKDLETFYRAYLEKFLEIFPDLDGLSLHPGVEGTSYEGAKDKYARYYLSGQNLAACDEAMNIYCRVVDEVTRKHKIDASYWTHQFGINSNGIVAMRKLLFKYPRLTIIEEDYWPNGLWMRGDKLPLMAYLDPKMRDELTTHGNKLAILALSDAEYYGGSALPNAIAEPYLYSMTESIKRNAAMIILRLNIHDRTPLGSLWAVNGIQFAQSTNLLWQNPAPAAQVWDNWIKRTYGPAAAPLISKALSNSNKIITDGMTVAGSNLLGKNSRIDITGWMPEKGRISKFSRPARPDKPAPRPFKEGAVIESHEQTRAQTNPQPVTFADFQNLNRSAAAEVQKSLALIDQARPLLAKPDYLYLHEIHDAARIIIDLAYALNQAAYAASLVKDNYDNHPDPKAYFEQSIRTLEQLAASPDIHWIDSERFYVYGEYTEWIKSVGGQPYKNLAQRLRDLTAAYRNFVNGTPEPTNTTEPKKTKTKKTNKKK